MSEKIYNQFTVITHAGMAPQMCSRDGPYWSQTGNMPEFMTRERAEEVFETMKWGYYDPSDNAGRTLYQLVLRPVKSVPDGYGDMKETRIRRAFNKLSYEDIINLGLEEEYKKLKK